MELESIRYSKNTESGSEGCQEINHETTFSSSFPMQKDKPQTKDDFFIHYNNIKYIKVSLKKRKGKKSVKEKPKHRSSLTTISSELLNKPLIEENVIGIIKLNDGGDKHNYLQEALKKGFIINKKKYVDVEEGRGEAILGELQVTFPNILENVSRQNASLSSQYTKPVLFTDIVMADEDNDKPGKPRFLDIHIKNLRFIHHHEFTLEMLLGIKLEAMYEYYEINKKVLNNLQLDIDANRKRRTNLQHQFFKNSPDKKDELRFDKTILKYTRIMLELKEKYYGALNNNKKLVHYMTSLWTDIETLRSKTGHITAPQSLDIIKQEISEDDFNETWMQIFEREYSDMLIKVEYEFVCEYLQYKQLKSTQGRKDVVKPKLQLDSDKIKDTARSLVHDIVNKQNVEIKLRKNEKWKKRSKDHNRKHAYFIKLYVDNVFVCETEKYFSAKIGTSLNLEDTISIEILDSNKSIKINLYENEDEISYIKVDLNQIKESRTHANFSTQKIVNDNIIAPTPKYVGSGYDIKAIAAANNIRLTSSNLFKGKLFTTFELSIKVGWNEKTTTNDEQVKSFMDLRMSVRKLFLDARKPTVELLYDLIGKVYEKNVANDIKLLDALKGVCKDKVISNEHIRNEDKKLSARLRLLHLRSAGKLGELENERVPVVESQISTEQLNALPNKDNNKTNNYDDKELNPIDLQRYLSAKYITTLNNNLLAKIYEFLLQKTYKDVVRDFEYLNIRNLFSIGLRLNLSPASALTRQQVLNDCLKHEQEIRVTVIRAHNLLDRTPILDIEGNQNSEEVAGFKMRSLRPFLRVSYHSEAVQTPTALGCYPTWNHTVAIKSKLDPLSCIHINIYDEYRTSVIVDPTSEQSLHQRRHSLWLGTLQIPLRSVLEAGNLAGAFKISTPPFMFGYEPSKERSTADVMQLLKKDTAFILLNITTNISHLAAHSYSEAIVNNDKDDQIIRQINLFTADYLNNFPNRNLSLTFVDSSGCNRCITEFIQPLVVPDDSYFPRDPKRNESGVSKGSAHSKSSSSKSSRRKSIDGDVSPFSNAGSWTKTERQYRSIIDALIRYVSLIPTYEVLEAHAVTLTGMELLKILYGSPLDHTLLLASFFTYLGIKCYVIIGWGLPRGATSYVLVKYYQDEIVTVDKDIKKGFFAKVDGTSWHVYDAVAGQRYDIREIECPLKTVSHVFNCENRLDMFYPQKIPVVGTNVTTIWVNVQSSQECGNISMDLAKTSDWQPVFNRPLFVMRPLENSYSPPRDTEELRLALESKIKSKIQKWRSHAKTVWNRYSSGLLRETLSQWEYWAFNPSNPKPSLGQRLKQLMVTYKIWGFPLNMPYTNSKQITSRIKSTAIHVVDDPSVEFGLAVEVFPYPNNILSVWVYLASITKINDL